jgi:hypothetical protein
MCDLLATGLDGYQAETIRLKGTIDIHQERCARVHPKDDIFLDARLRKG